jgi:hypothetical protein
MTLRDSVEVMTQRLDQEMLSGKGSGLNCSAWASGKLAPDLHPASVGKETR